ncbi:uncharacterized protein A4U43_C03F21120 [Asparagus officinalis]|uniref:Protein kinase domain-containing protein n=1 Tax=Asparagus officinalis TaxID=4686 RepID=A0A5P1FGT5_ASPOF|nr:probable receptor-like protein kinase At5g61350 [Asparagus officinalis]ONK75841.1 uncharacterized protein A4U43_C03F21120 [Asparagus officinalis]
MTRGEKDGYPPIFSLIIFFSSAALVPQARALSSPTDANSQPTIKFTPTDNYLISCGSPNTDRLNDGRTFKSDAQSLSSLSTKDNIKIVDTNTNANDSIPPLYSSARVFTDLSTYKFTTTPGHHWVRLHFYPLPDPTHNMSSAKFTVNTDDIVLLRDFSISATTPLIKEYLIVSKDGVSLNFAPSKGSIAFINAIELVSAPDSLIHSTAKAISPEGEFSGISNYALEVTHRLNVGGPEIQSANDTLARTWRSDTEFLKLPQSAKSVLVLPKTIKYPSDGSVTDLDAPSLVYSTAVEMGNSNVSQPNFNITWEVPSNPEFSYLIRMHFCDIVSKNLNSLYFNVYLNGMTVVSSLDLSTLTTGLAVAYMKDFVVNASTIVNSTILVQVGVVPGSSSGNPNAILNGLEVMKMSNLAGSLDGAYAVDGSYHGNEVKKSRTKKIVAGVGITMGAIALALFGFMFLQWRKQHLEKKRNSFSSWLLPVHTNNSNLASNSTKGSSRHKFGSRKSSRQGHTSYFAANGLGIGRYFSLAELQEATKNFDENAVIGVGGFGKVYIGELEDGTKLAVKRGNPSSDQGINEFHTEIEMLSKLRHRHLVSLIGCCDENSEMILVYEFMANGPLRDHLYGSTSHTPLSWKQRLEACIGAARGLHYLHTGAAQGIIHRDVKTTNILLDENLVGKMADFGLSKTGPSLQQTHVSTAVKGSFGYLDPEYFRSQQLTDKSDVYSFGVVLFEVLCARPAIIPTLPRDQVNLAEWAMQSNRKGQLEKIIDPNLVGKISPASLKKFVEAAEKCVAEHGVDRPTMGDVLWNLEYALQLQEASIGQHSDEPSGDSSRHLVLESPEREEGNLATINESEESPILVPAPLFQGR